MNPLLTPELRYDDFYHPLQLLAKRVRFHDPVTDRDMEYESGRELRI